MSIITEQLDVAPEVSILMATFFQNDTLKSRELLIIIAYDAEPIGPVAAILKIKKVSSR